MHMHTYMLVKGVQRRQTEMSSLRNGKKLWRHVYIDVPSRNHRWV